MQQRTRPAAVEEHHMPPISYRVRVALASAVAVVAFCATAAPAVAAPQITLLAPADGATVTTTTDRKGPVFQWRVDWPDAPPAGTVTLIFADAADAAITQDVGGTVATCPVQNLACFATFGPNPIARPGKRYWRVTLIAAGVQATSAVWSYTAVEPQDADRDGVVDAIDNCPSVKNPRQEDSNRDRRGDACQPDRTPPRVRALAGRATRGRTAFFLAHVGDDRGYARLRVVLSYRGHPILVGAFAMTPVNFVHEIRFYSQQPLSPLAPPGLYRACVTAWDRAGNRARSCAPYVVR
jgi:hypothetical protein